MLGEHFALGRIDADEFAQRLDNVYAARSLSKLQLVLEGLPAPASEELPPPRIPKLAPPLAIGLIPFATCVLIWLVSGTHGGFWPIWALAALPLRLFKDAQKRWT
jgi:hypothetical protein